MKVGVLDFDWRWSILSWWFCPETGSYVSRLSGANRASHAWISGVGSGTSRRIRWRVPAMKRLLCFSVLLAVALCLCASFAPDDWGAAAAVSVSPRESGTPSPKVVVVSVPGPLRSFLRMAGISQKVSPAEVMPFLARNVFIDGYRYNGGHSLQPTEFLILLRRYVQQARELAMLAGPDGIIHISGCDDAKRVLEVLGYRARPDCGQSGTFLETADRQRAFLTIDSGFPLLDLERTLQGSGAFTYAFPTSHVPVLLTERDWTAVSRDAKNAKDIVDLLLHDPAVARLYYAWTRIDAETQMALQRSPGLRRLAPLAASFYFYGSYIRIRSGRVIVPGGPTAESAWENLVGASPDSPGEFVPGLLAKDNGWLAAYYDSLARVSPAQQAQLTRPPRLQHLYAALRGKDTRPSATASAFRPDPELLLLMTRLQWDANSDPHVPGDLQAWKKILKQTTSSYILRALGARTTSWNNSEGLLETLFALSRLQIDRGPCQAFLMLSELDRRRPEAHRLSPQTVELMAGKFSEFSDQYLIFSEFPELSDASIALFIKTGEALGRIPDQILRGNAMGIFQANVGLWQILARQGQISDGNQDHSWQETIRPFVQISSSTQLFDAGRKSLEELMLAATSEMRRSQSEIVDLLAGPRQTTPAGQKMHAQVAGKIQAVLDDQRLVSLDTLLALADGLKAMAQGASRGDRLVPLARKLRAFQMPRPMFSRSERTQWTAGGYNNRHTELEMRTDLTRIITSSPSNEQLEDARGQLAPFLRDTLVGLNYAYYEPPGAQALHNNALLVRSHDFAGVTIMGMEQRLWQRPRLLGAGSTAGGGAHLVGSLADLPYVLAEMEQDFIVPENVQALIWQDLVPGVLLNAVLPRWWSVTQNELHAVALYQRGGEELLTASAENEELRIKVINVLSLRLNPQRSSWLDTSLREGRLSEVFAQLAPADLFYLTAEFRRRFPGETNSWGLAGQELDNLCRQYPAELSWERLSRDFGVSHPIVARTYARELLNGQPPPMFTGYSSRLLAETWDSTNLYWARLADEKGYLPATLNALVPTLTLRMITKIFATDQDDWPAILRAMRETGEDFRQGKVASLPADIDAIHP